MTKFLGYCKSLVKNSQIRYVGKSKWGCDFIFSYSLSLNPFCNILQSRLHPIIRSIVVQLPREVLLQPYEISDWRYWGGPLGGTTDYWFLNSCMILLPKLVILMLPSIPASAPSWQQFEDEKREGTALVSLGAAASLLFLFLPAGLAFYTARFSLSSSSVAFDFHHHHPSHPHPHHNHHHYRQIEEKEEEALGRAGRDHRQVHQHQTNFSHSQQHHQHQHQHQHQT